MSDAQTPEPSPLVTGPPFPFIPVDGGGFDHNAALLRTEMRIYAEIAQRAQLRIKPRSFIILTDVGA